MTIDSSSLFNDPPFTTTRLYAGEARIANDLIFWNPITQVIKARINADNGNLNFEVNEVDRMIIKADGEVEIDGYIKSTNPSFSIATDELVFRDSALNQLGYIDDQGVIHGLTMELGGQIPVIDINSGTTGTLAANRIANLPASKITSGTLDNARLNLERPFDRLYAIAPSQATFIQSDAQVFMDTGYNEIAQIDNVNGLSINKIQAKTGNDVIINDNLKVDNIIPNTGNRITLGSSALYSPYVDNSTYELHALGMKARTGNLNFYADNFNVFPLAGGASKFSVDGFGRVNATDGSGIEKLNASYLFSGTINNARLPTTPTFNGVNFNTLGSGDWAKLYTEGTEENNDNDLEHKLVVELGDDADPTNFIIRRYSDSAELFRIDSEQGLVSIIGSIEAPSINLTGTLRASTLRATTRVETNFIDAYLGSTITFGDTIISPEIRNPIYKSDTHTFYNTGGTTAYMVLDSTGVGIRNTPNGYTLNVEGTTRIGGNLNVEAIRGNAPFIQSTGLNNYIRAFSDGSNYSDSNSLFIRTRGGALNAVFDNENGRVGIGTSSPSAKLDVNGNANISGNLTARPNGNWGFITEHFTTYTRLSILDQNGVVSGGTPSLLFTSQAVRLDKASLDVDGDISLFDLTNDQIRVIRINYNTKIESAWTYYGTGINYQGGDSFLWKTKNDATTLMTLDGTGRLGIGATPSYKLDILGTARAGTFKLSTAYGGAYTDGVIYTDDNWGMLFRGTGPENIAEFRWDNTAGAERMRMANGNLGIGITNPSYKVDVGSNGGSMRATTYYAQSASHETYYVSYGIDHFLTDYSITCVTAGKNLLLNTNGGEILSNSPILLTDSSGTGTARPTQMFSVWTDEKFGMELQYRKGTWNTTFITRDFDGGFLFATDEGDEVFYIDSRNGGNSRIAYGESGEYINLTRIGVEPSIFPSENNYGYCGTETQAWYFVWTNFLRVKDNLYGGYDNGSGNFHIDSVEGGGAIYLNWYGGTGGTRCGNGSAGYGPVYASSYPGTSDDRLKHNEEDIVDALGTINKLKLQKYDKTGVMLDADFNGDLGDIPHEKEIGFIAQDIQQIPELAFLVKEQDPIPINAEGPVLEGEEPLTIQQEQPLTLNYQGINSLAVQAIQELDAKVKAQEEQINNLLQIVNELREANNSGTTAPNP